MTNTYFYFTVSLCGVKDGGGCGLLLSSWWILNGRYGLESFLETCNLFSFFRGKANGLRIICTSCRRTQQQTTVETSE